MKKLSLLALSTLLCLFPACRKKEVGEPAVRESGAEQTVQTQPTMPVAPVTTEQTTPIDPTTTKPTATTTTTTTETPMQDKA